MDSQATPEHVFDTILETMAGSRSQLMDVEGD